ncbi:MAG: hypothetical protein QG594_2592 [Bacteroidota bacterium]|nr:hypothetical protein [Bacteroidota bacterium]
MAELRHLNKRLRIELAELKKQPKPQMTKEDFKEQRFIELNKTLSEKGKLIKTLGDRAAFWQSKYLSLKALNQTI